MTTLRNDRYLSVHDLKRRIAENSIDTVVVAFTDMQGRLQGKRLHAAYFVDHVLEHGTEGCAYLLAVDIDMNTVDGYALTSWDQGYGDLEFALDLETIRLLPHLPGTALIQCDLVGLDHGPRAGLAADDPEAAAGGAGRGRLRRAGRHRIGVLDLRRQLRGRLEVRLSRPHPGQPVQHRLLGAGHQPRRAAAAGSPEHPVRGGDGRRIGQGRMQPRPAGDRLPLRRRLDHRRQPRRLQDRGQGDRRGPRAVDQFHGQVRRAGRQLLSHPPVAAWQ